MKWSHEKCRVLGHRTKAFDRGSIVVRKQVKLSEVVRDGVRFAMLLAYLLELAARFIVAAQRQQAGRVLKACPHILRIERQSLLELARRRLEQLLRHELRSPVEVRLNAGL